MLGYRSFVTVDNRRDEVVRLALEQLYSWLRGKHYDSDAMRMNEKASLADGVDGLLVERRSRDGSRWVRARVVERRSRSRWISELTVGVPGRASRAPWVWVDIESQEKPGGGQNGGRRWTATPGLARRLAEVFDARDGRGVLGPAPLRVGADEIESLVEVICDEERRGLVFVAGSDDRLTFEPWVTHVRKLTKESVGLAGAYVLDPDATAAVNVVLGGSHQVAPWTIRTFRPGADLTSSLDGLRHRILSLKRITTAHDGALTRMYGWRARDEVLRAPLSKAVLRINRDLEQAIDELLLSTLSPDEEGAALSARAHPAVVERPSQVEAAELQVVDEPSPRDVIQEAESTLALSGVLSDVLGEAVITIPAIETLGRLARIGRRAEANQADLAEHLSARGDQVDSLTTERDQLRRRLDDEQLEHAETEDNRIRAEELVLHLRRLLRESNREADAWTEPAQSEVRPTSYRELLEKMGSLDFVVFTGDEDVLIDLEEYDHLFRWGGKIWDSLCALEDYGRASTNGGCPRDVDGYLRNLPDGCRGYSVNRHARDESEDVRNSGQLHRLRVLPVPSVVDPQGKVFMGAHFKIAQSGLISPRLHYYDDTARSGKLYVGHIGRHLRTKQTN